MYQNKDVFTFVSDRCMSGGKTFVSCVEVDLMGHSLSDKDPDIDTFDLCAFIKNLQSCSDITGYLVIIVICSTICC